jgi:hypothetical protein
MWWPMCYSRSNPKIGHKRKKNWSSQSASSRSNLEEIICLSLPYILWSWICEDVLKESFPIVVYGGAIHKTLPSKLNQERWFNLRRSRSSLSTSSGMLKAKVWYWYGFFLTGLMVLVMRLGYWIGSRNIKRGSRVSNLILSFGESSNLCRLGIIFLGLICLLSMCGSRACGYFHDKL